MGGTLLYVFCTRTVHCVSDVCGAGCRALRFRGDGEERSILKDKKAFSGKQELRWGSGRRGPNSDTPQGMRDAVSEGFDHD